MKKEDFIKAVKYKDFLWEGAYSKKPPALFTDIDKVNTYVKKDAIIFISVNQDYFKTKCVVFSVAVGNNLEDYVTTEELFFNN